MLFRKFKYILNLPEFDMLKEKIYIGDLKGYFNWFDKLFFDR